jgi:hypothetical protein
VAGSDGPAALVSFRTGLAAPIATGASAMAPSPGAALAFPALALALSAVRGTVSPKLGALAAEGLVLAPMAASPAMAPAVAVAVSVGFSALLAGSGRLDRLRACK